MSGSCVPVIVPVVFMTLRRALWSASVQLKSRAAAQVRQHTLDWHGDNNSPEASAAGLLSSISLEKSGAVELFQSLCCCDGAPGRLVSHRQSRDLNLR